MWVLIAREPPPDAPFWPGRRGLAAVDAVLWPSLWCLVFMAAPAPVGLVPPMVYALAVLSGLGRLRRALWMNHRYRFTTWRCGWRLAGLLLIGVVLHLALGA